MTTWNTGNPTAPGWYLVKRPPETDLRIRAFGKDSQWWIDLGRGNGQDGWMSSPDGCYSWLGPVADVMDDKPSIPQAIRNLPQSERDFIMSEAADVYIKTMLASEILP